MKVKLSINPQTTRLPLILSKGTEKQRFKKADIATSLFIDNIKNAYKDNDKVALITFKKAIKDSLSHPINILVNATEFKSQKGYTGYEFLENGIARSFRLFLKTDLTNKVSKSTSVGFIQNVQEIFGRIYNPKIAQREIKTFLNPKSEQITNFIDKLLSKKEITEKEVRDLTRGLKPEEKIDVLQLLRYRVKIASHTKKSGLYATPLDKSITIIPTPYRSFHFEDKMNILNTRLEKIIKKERLKNKNSMI